MRNIAKVTFKCIIALSLVAVILNFSASIEAAPPIKLGVISAWDYPGGEGVKRGAELAIRDINAAGGLLGRKVKGIFYDNKLQAGEAKKATERLLYKDKVDAVCGFWRSDLAIVCQPLVMEAKKILLIGGASTPVITFKAIKKDYENNKYTFTVVANSYFLASVLAKPLIIARKDFGLNKLAIIGEKAAWYDPLHQKFSKTFGDILVSESRFSPDATDFSVEFTKAKSAGANVVYFVTTGKAGTASVKQWYDMELPMLYLGYNVAAQDPNFPKMTEGKCEGVVSEVSAGAAGFAITKKSRPWYENYKKTFGHYPTAYTNGTAYDIVMAWAKGVKLAGTVQSDAVVKAMESPKFHYVGVCGVVDRFDKIHNPVGGGWKEGQAWGFVIFQWQKGKREVVYPEALKTAELIIPERVKKLMGR